MTALYSKSRESPPRAVLTPARVGRYYHLYTIYIPPYAVPPTTLTPGSKVRVSGLTGSQGHRVTRSTYHQGHRVTWVTWVSGHLGYWVTMVVYLTHMAHLWSRVTLHTRVTMVTWLGSLVTDLVTWSRVTISPSPTTRSPGSQGHHTPWSPYTLVTWITWVTRFGMLWFWLWRSP